MGFSLGGLGGQVWKGIGGTPGAVQLGLGALGAFQGSRAATGAANTQAAAGREALALQQQMYNQGRADMAPYVQAGGGAMSTLSRLMTPGYETPDYGSNYGGPMAGQAGPGGPTLASPMGTPPVAQGIVPTPTRDTSEAGLNTWNQNLRQSDVYLNFLRAQGIDPNGKIKLSDDQQKGLEQALAAGGQAIPGGMHIDAAGNLNQKNRLLRNIGIGAAIGGAAITGFGLAGMGPLAGALGTTAAAAPGIGATAPGIIMGSGLPAGAAAAGGGMMGTLGTASTLMGLGQQGYGLVQQARANQPVLMIARDGSSAHVPPEHVQMYLAQGARVA